MFFLFVILNNQIFLALISSNSHELKNSNSYLILKPTPDIALLFNLFNNNIPENPEKTIQGKYYGTDEFQKLKIPNKEKVSISFSC